MIRVKMKCRMCGFRFVHNFRDSSAGKTLRVKCPRHQCVFYERITVPTRPEKPQ
jgi:hypothetical protein